MSLRIRDTSSKRGQQPFGYDYDAAEGDLVCNVTSRDCMRDGTMRIYERGGRYVAEQEAAELACLTRSIVMYVLSWCVSCFRPGEMLPRCTRGLNSTQNTVVFRDSNEEWAS